MITMGKSIRLEWVNFRLLGRPLCQIVIENENISSQNQMTYGLETLHVAFKTLSRIKWSCDVIGLAYVLQGQHG